jgi:branched-chain amino acid aminotransferase
MHAVGPYYATGFKPISLWADTEHVRAWPGGTGDAKVKNLYRIIATLQKQF